MSDVAIRVENLSKKYVLGNSTPSGYRTLRESITDILAAPFRRFSAAKHPTKRTVEPFWALRDVSFVIPRGEAVGIIGRNGAGKSTLLKILSRITDPTTGYAEIHGRVGSLLEVGTGFHPELTGRENVFLNGAILGMRRGEIARRFDEIVAFSEVEKFIDAPVKHYSSGMYLRLAFAVAAHLEPEILLVDEVLAVGDASFQKKCLGKMNDVTQAGRTVVFISHNLTAIADLCTVAYQLDRGRIKSFGPPSEVIRQYLSTGESEQYRDLRTHPGRSSSYSPLLQSIRLTSNGILRSTFAIMDSFEFSIECQADPQYLPAFSLGFLIKNAMGVNIFGSNMSQYEKIIPNCTGQMIIHLYLDELRLVPGTYTITLFLGNGLKDFDIVEDAISFDVLWDANMFGEGVHPPNPRWGSLATPVRWDYEEVPTT